MLHGDAGLNEIFAQQPKYEEDTSKGAKFVKQKISVARGSLILDQPFFGYLLGHYQIVVVDDTIAMYAADTNHLYFNTDYMKDLIKYNENWKGKVKGILIHLLIHIIFRHHRRQKGMVPQIWGYATDIVVFSHLRDIKKKWQAPADWDIADLRQVPEELIGHSAERTYELLVELIEQQQEEEDKGRGADTDGEEGDNEDQQEQRQNLEEYVLQERSQIEDQIGMKSNSCDIEDMVMESVQGTEMEEIEEQYFEGMLRTAYEQQKGFGSLPEGLDRFVSKRLEPKIDWKAKLSKYLQKILVHDLTWTRPNKRLYGQGYYLPGPLKKNTEVLLGVDTSGSIDDDILGIFLTEAQAILETITNVKLIVVDCDAEIQQISEYEAGETITNHTFKGKGGTDFRPVFELTTRYQPDVIVYITDGYGTYPDDQPEIPVIWVMTTEKEPEFGEIIRLDM